MTPVAEALATTAGMDDAFRLRSGCGCQLDGQGIIAHLPAGMPVSACSGTDSLIRTLSVKLHDSASKLHQVSL
jgi:hypothetical protein